MIETGYWLLLTSLFAFLMLLVQRSERNRQLATFVILMLLVVPIVYGYGIYRISHDCHLPFALMCRDAVFQAQRQTLAYNTTNWAIVAALIVNFLFWALIGRYNPPGTSQDIKVLGLKD